MSPIIYTQHHSIYSPSPLPKAKNRQLNLTATHGELIALTGDPRTATILSQLLYLSWQVKNFDLYIEEEKSSLLKAQVRKHGWFSKTVAALQEETRLRVTIGTFRRYLAYLIDRGWVQTRPNAQDRWTGGKQYRVNLKKLQADLDKKGYNLPVFAEYFTKRREESELIEKGDL